MAEEVRVIYWSSNVCSSGLLGLLFRVVAAGHAWHFRSLDGQSDGTRTLQAVCCYDNAHAARLRLLACLLQAETTVRRRVILCPSAVGAQHQSGAVAWACHRPPRALHR